MKSNILSQHEVSSLQFVSKEEALADFKTQLGEEADLLAALRADDGDSGDQQDREAGKQNGRFHGVPNC